MKIGVLFGAMFALATTSIVAAQQTTIRIPVGPDELDIVTFDKSRVSVSAVTHWMKFAKNGYYDSSGISLSGCEKTAIVRTSKDVYQGRRVKNELNREAEYPRELSPVVTYLKHLMRFKLWLGVQYLAFVESGTAPESMYEGKALPACRALAERIRVEPDTEKRCQLLGNEWTKCTLQANLRWLGAYPTSQWKAFLDANGIHEHVTSTTNE